MKFLKCLLLLILLVAVISGCTRNKMATSNGLYFTQLKSNKTNIDFDNKLVENDSVNFVADQYIYIGSGVAVADFNKDGLQDVFFAGGQVSSKLYINKGDFVFEDVTQKAGVATSTWCTGVTVVDINNDSLPDLYVCVSHSSNPAQRKNYLFINNGNLTFRDEAVDYGLADSGFSTQAAFFDFDNDGDQDMYLMRHNVFQNQPNNIVAQQAVGSPTAADKLYRNEGIPPGKTHPVFADFSAQAGIREDGYGLGLSICDINKDGWPDVYVANDFISNDLLWLNNKNGTFTNSIAKAMHHQSYNSMGVDAADINNDGLPDIGVLDMLPQTNYRKKTMFAGANAERYDMEQMMGGYQPEFTRNMLQLNNGFRKADTLQMPYFSEIGQLAGMSETDWSWSLLMADFDNDGLKDIHITNGIAKDLTNNDFLFYGSTQNSGNFNSALTDHGNKPGVTDLRKKLDSFGQVQVNNFLYINNGNLGFNDETDSAQLGIPSVSHGAAYADLDNDGDLDLVVNNMNQPAFVFRNELRKSPVDSVHNYLTIKLDGNKQNLSGDGAKITLYAGGVSQYIEQYPVRGYLSCVDQRPHFGVGNAAIIDSIKIAWPGNKTQLVKNIKPNQFITLHYSNAVAEEASPADTVTPVFMAADNQLNNAFRHNEKFFFDYAYQRALPQKYSQLGPPIASGDINGDGLMDFFIGGASQQSGKLYTQQAAGTFIGKDLVSSNKTSEDIAAVFFDADGDKDSDLLVCEGSYEYGNNAALNQLRLYKNDGKGNFELDANAMPAGLSTISTAIAVKDYDGDGDEDLFIGGRILPNQYPLSPRSYILQNNNGKFTDVTKMVCPALGNAGLITAAIFTDIDKDHLPDLVICGEWMPVRFFKNNKGRFDEITDGTGLTGMKGWWRSLQAADLDGDGDMDMVAGNMGLNNRFHISANTPYQLFVKDLDGNGTLDLIPAYYIKNNQGQYQLFPALDRTQFAEQVPAIKKKYLYNRDYAVMDMQKLFDDISETSVPSYTCETSASCWLENLGGGKFKSHQLPVEAQFAPVNAIIAADLDSDGKTDLLLAGNEYQVEIANGRYDASYGVMLKGNGKGKFAPVTASQSGFVIAGDVKHLALITGKNNSRWMIAAVNNDSLKCFKINDHLQK